ncbi:MAG: DUF3426 domain-containing protein [Rhodocyclaceae bacterium]|jgi:predicted Zn finger-like uncharacterized protein
MMLTRCPACGTAFRVTPEQIKARAGKVRCGHCNAVFNALETLEDAAPSAETVETPSPPAETARPAPAEEPQAEPPAEIHPPAAPESAPQSTPAPAAAAAPVFELPSDGRGGKAATPVSRGRLLAWSLTVLVMLGVFALQGAYVFRAELAAAEPELRPLLEDLCRRLDCEVPLPRKADLVSIEASDLHPDPQQKRLLVLAATLKNRATFVQAYPHLEITLTDVRDQPVLRKVLPPADYLAGDADARAGFPANGDLAVNLWLDPGEVGASGYRLYLFYP